MPRSCCAAVARPLFTRVPARIARPARGAAALAIGLAVLGVAAGPGSAGPAWAAGSAWAPISVSPAGQTATRCPTATITVGTARDLDRALATAQPGTTIVLRPGVYSGRFVARTSGTAAAPITLCGTSDAVLDGGSKSKGYVLQLDGASSWRVLGFTVRNGQKGVMADAVHHTTIQGLTVEAIGDEGIHLRRNSTDNTVADNRILSTGLHSKQYGEGIYVGSAKSNWGSVTRGQPDRSDRNEITGNVISGTTAEAVDIKEGTTGGKLTGNVFNGATITAADSAVDVKGNGWLVSGNVVTAAPWDAFQTHRILSGWGEQNVFRANIVRSVRKSGGDVVGTYPQLTNVVSCDNTGPAGMDLTRPGCR